MMFSQLMSKSKPNRGKSANDSNSKCGKEKGPACTNCSKPGHNKPECWAKGGGAEGTRPHQKRHTAKQAKDGSNKPGTSKTKSAKVVIASDNTHSTPMLYALPAVEIPTTNTSWLLDSGASRHMTPHQHWFATYQNLPAPIYI